MPLGSAVRKSLGRWEPAAIRLYRDRFIDLDALAVTIASIAPSAKRVLEIGSGDGAMAGALRRALPDCEILGIDPSPKGTGQFYEGDPHGVRFRSMTTTDLIAEAPPAYDVVVLCDVVHHVAEDARQQIVNDAATLAGPGGVVAFKEWELRPGLGYYAGYISDRLVSGDAGVRYMPKPELQNIIESAMPGWRLLCEARIPPRRANILFALRRP